MPKTTYTSKVAPLRTVNPVSQEIRVLALQSAYLDFEVQRCQGSDADQAKGVYLSSCGGRRISLWLQLIRAGAYVGMDEQLYRPWLHAPPTAWTAKRKRLQTHIE